MKRKLTEDQIREHMGILSRLCKMSTVADLKGLTTALQDLEIPSDQHPGVTKAMEKERDKLITLIQQAEKLQKSVYELGVPENINDPYGKLFLG